MNDSVFSIEGMVLFQLLIVVVAAAVSTVIDLRTRLIPNLITLPLILTGPIVMGVAYGWDGVLNSLLGFLLLGVPYLVIWMLSGGGAGDAKLMMGIGAWVGPGIGIWILVTTMIAGGVFSIIAAAIYGRLRELPYSVMIMLMGLVSRFRSKLQPVSGVEATAGGADEDPVSSSSQWIPFAPVILIGTAVGGALWAIYAQR